MSPPLSQFVPLFARVVNSTFGGGSTILGVFRRELVDRLGWLTDEQFGLSYAVARITPGTSILAFCAAAGWTFGSLRGAVFSVLAAAVPCAGIAVAMLLMYDELQTLPWFMTAIRGAMASAIGVMLASGWAILRPYFRSSSTRRTSVILVGSIVLMLVVRLSPVPILGLAALLGFLLPEGNAKEPASE